MNSVILKSYQGKIINDEELKYIVQCYMENPKLKLSDLNREMLPSAKKPAVAHSGIESCNCL
jgi:hypothetical protein